MTNTNPHTGARLVSKGYTEEGKKNFDLIFGKPEWTEILFKGADASQKAEEYLKEKAVSYPDWEYVMNFQEDGILITGRPIK
jgi:hypothetical protein